MAGRKIRDAADARACLAAVQASGMSAVAWAGGSGVDARSLNTWRLNLTRRAGSSPGSAQGVRLVEWVPTAAPPAPQTRHYTVRCGGLAVDVDGDFDESSLRRLLGVLLSC